MKELFEDPLYDDIKTLGNIKSYKNSHGQTIESLNQS